MLKRRRADDAIAYYISPLLEAVGVPHAFSTRGGGVSEGPFASLNLGISVDGSPKDATAHVYENYRRLMAAVGCGSRERCWVTQVHGSMTCDVRAGQAFESGACADALVCDDPGRVVSVKYADCVPILLSTRDGRGVAAVHAGWRGVVAGVVKHGVERLRAFGSSPDLVAAIGPCISEPFFEVGPEVVAELERLWGTAAPLRRTASGKGHVDLKKAVQLQLIEAGVPGEWIDISDRCTVRDADDFYSHRRDRGVTGRMAALIGPLPPAAGSA